MGTAGTTEEEQLRAMDEDRGKKKKNSGKELPDSKGNLETGIKGSRNSIKELMDALWREQTTNWPLMKKGYADLQQLLTKDISVNHIPFKAQHNPARIVSSAAKTDRESIAARPCFLCRHNLPTEQKGLLLLGRYIVLTNPFPIVERHFVIPCINHIPQRLMGDEKENGSKRGQKGGKNSSQILNCGKQSGRQNSRQNGEENENENDHQILIGNSIEDMARLAELFSELLDIYFNGATCGASAPDHFHFQAGPQGTLPLMEQHPKAPIIERDGGSIRLMEEQPRTVLLLQANSISALCSLWSLLTEGLKEIEVGDDQLNLVLRHTEAKKWQLWVILRSKHRPECYFREGDEQFLCSPGVIDMSGIAVLPRPEDYSRITGTIWMRLMEEVSLPADKFHRLIELLKR